MSVRDAKAIDNKYFLFGLLRTSAQYRMYQEEGLDDIVDDVKQRCIMLDFDQAEEPRPKCQFSTTQLPNYLDHGQPPLKRKPFSSFANQDFIYNLNILLPKSSAQGLSKTTESEIGTIQYAKVYMKLKEIISGDFFNHYIKTGNILMISEGRTGIDNTFTLRNGILRLELDRPTYERAGLQGTPISAPARKHIKSRYAIELNLRLPSMVRGRKGFERVVWAFNNALSDTLTWLFCDLNVQNDITSLMLTKLDAMDTDVAPSAQTTPRLVARPISVHQPIERKVDARVSEINGVTVPAFPTKIADKDRETAAELLEWLTLAMIDSPRIASNDKIDPLLSRYQIPVLTENESTVSSPVNLVKFEWRGLIPSQFVLKMVLASLKASGPNWAAINTTTFNSKNLMVLLTKDQSMTWEYSG